MTAATMPGAGPQPGSVPQKSTRWAATPAETARLRRQSDELRPQSAELLGRIGLAPGQSAIDLGCGPSGILDLLSAAVFPGGRVVGLDADPAHTAMARQYASERGLANVERGDGRRQAHRPAAGQLRPGARPDGAGHDPRTRGGARRDGPAGPAGRLGRQPGTRHRERVLLPAAACLGPAPRDLPRQLRPVRRRPADRPPPSRAVPAGRAGGDRGRRCTPRSTRRVTRAARSCPTWCAACGP